MLVVHANSTCDVCLESYSSGAHAPHSITCGHVFCASCIESLSRPICPLCRTMFEESDVRKLHIDRSQSPRNPTAIAHEARRYQQDITRIVKEGAPASELGALISRCHLWLKTQAPDQVT
ncbi:hypothetical protein FIBSPDRAFT_720330 [Athelia psychrophila]|uniref:RING-type domain-containing protein n=1 Tax=Athelia psychrophila TaxID=1759441 RepID=A0A166WRP1_9AGAM|nr:hypothetical protein FIBSPDRAFT_720330 [Fibularhizoctonia sp. CBS 109695]